MFELMRMYHISINSSTAVVSFAANCNIFFILFCCFTFCIQFPFSAFLYVMQYQRGDEIYTTEKDVTQPWIGKKFKLSPLPCPPAYTQDKTTAVFLNHNADLSLLPIKKTLFLFLSLSAIPIGKLQALRDGIKAVLDRVK